ncbi:hypothetical protein GJ744_011704 [Endocarpon pusillum]|uniref:Uncharacterized protein n=1 Tax=Endocarpon pusillum TaxID=364733 RepID=A0A8H7E0V5_9EURO|nr:hypothetical protein GJ744_011704 [Endocarpon pusillum]
MDVLPAGSFSLKRESMMTNNIVPNLKHDQFMAKTSYQMVGWRRGCLSMTYLAPISRQSCPSVGSSSLTTFDNLILKSRLTGSLGSKSSDGFLLMRSGTKQKSCDGGSWRTITGIISGGPLVGESLRALSRVTTPRIDKKAYLWLTNRIITASAGTCFECPEVGFSPGYDTNGILDAWNYKFSDDSFTGNISIPTPNGALVDTTYIYLDTDIPQRAI